MKQNALEIIIGFAVLIIAGYFAIYAYKNHSSEEKKDIYSVHCNFQNADGVTKGSYVKIAGINIGTVEKLELDKETYFAKITLNIDNAIKLPRDSSAAIVTSGLFGGKFIDITPGADDLFIADNGLIAFTQSSINFETIIRKFMLNISPEQGSR